MVFCWRFLRRERFCFQPFVALFRLPSDHYFGLLKKNEMRRAARPTDRHQRSGGEASKGRGVGKSYGEAFASRSASRSFFSIVQWRMSPGMWNILKINWQEDKWYSRTISSSCYQQWIRLERRFTFLRRYATNLSAMAFVAVVASYLLFPTVANADIESEAVRFDEMTVNLIVWAMQNKTEEFGHLPQSPDAAPRRHFTIPITAYTSDPRQTDDTPCITASGLDVCERGIENIVAANFLPLGTRVRIPELFGDRIFYVEDRMNARYHYKMDVWMHEIIDAKTFGVQFTTVEVF